jgi:hypothetical protein
MVLMSWADAAAFRVTSHQDGKPLEAEHKGEYLAISTSGKTVLGKSLSEVVANALSYFGKGNFIFKIGNRAVGSFRWATSS